VAQIGAALGRSFTHELISAAAQMPHPKLDDALEQLVRAELIFRRGTPPDAEYTFKHALVQDAAYSTLLRSRRQQLHGRIAATLEKEFPEIASAQPQLMAQHCAEAGLIEKAVGYWLKAGQQAVARSAMMEAIAQLQKGLDLLPSLPDETRRQQQELDLRVALGPALMATKGYAAKDVGEAFARARVLAEQLDRADYLVPLLYGQWAYHLVGAEQKAALPLAQRMEQIGESRNDVAALLLGRESHGLNRFFIGEPIAARALLDQCHDLRNPAHRAACQALTGLDYYGAMLAHLAATLANLRLQRPSPCANKGGALRGSPTGPHARPCGLLRVYRGLGCGLARNRAAACRESRGSRARRGLSVLVGPRNDSSWLVPNCPRPGKRRPRFAHEWARDSSRHRSRHSDTAWAAVTRRGSGQARAAGRGSR
jgi:hypothetical protein